MAHIREAVTHTVVVWMNHPRCPVDGCKCETWGFAVVVNHCIADRGYRLLPDVEQTERIGAGDSDHHIVAVLGK